MTPNESKMRHRVLEASAGTGKTYQIIRHAHDLIVGKGVPIDRLAIVTFSERAAGELRKRLRESLTSFAPGGPEQALRCREALSGLDRAMVTTIHGFCFAILREYAFEAGEPFALDVTRPDEVFPAMYDRYIRGELRRIIMNEPGWEALAQAIAENEFHLDLVTQASRFYHPRTCTIHPDPDRLFDPRPDCEEIIAGLSLVAPQKKPSKSLEKICETRAALESILAAGTSGKPLVRELIENRAWKAVFNANGLDVSANVAKLLAAAGPAGGTTLELLCGLAVKLAATAHDILARIIKDSARFSRLLMRHEGTIDYPGMLSRTLEAIERSPALAEMLRERFVAALVDEFQDTDPVQWRIFDLLFAGRPDRHLFVVGDAKQAIYGFRGADVETFQGAIARLEEIGAERETLSENYRSAPLLVEAIDRLFHESGIVGEYERITPSSGRCLLEDGKPVLHPLQIAVSKAETASKARGEYVAFVVREIRALLEGGFVYRDRAGSRPLRADDIAVLVRGAADERNITAALSEAGVPYVTRRHERLLRSVEASEIALVLDAVADPTSASAVKKALLTRFFRFPAERLEGFDGLSPADPLAVRLRAWAHLAAEGNWPALFRSLFDETGRLIEAAADDEDPDAGVSTLLDLGRELALIADRERLDPAGLSRRIVAEQKLGTSDDRPGMLLRVESDQPKVQIMTVHAAKGLEFPVVFVLGWFTAFNSDQYLRYHIEDSDAEGRRAWRIDLSGSDDAMTRHTREAREEESRLFYVALTRAVGRVYVPFMSPSRVPRWGGPLFTYLGEGMKKAFPGLSAYSDGNSAEAAAVKGVRFRILGDADRETDDGAPSPTDPRTVTVRQANVPERELEPPPERRTALKHLFIPLNSFSSLASRHAAKATAIMMTGDDPASLEDDRETSCTDVEYLPCDEPGEAGPEEAAGPETALPAGARTGTLFHAAMELLDYEAAMAAESPADLLAGGTASRELFERLFRRYPIRRHPDPEDLARLAEMTWKTLRTPLPFLDGRPLGACRERRHELTFWMPAPGARYRDLLGMRVSGGLLTGAMDLIINYNNKYYIIDFKTNRSTDGYAASRIKTMMDDHGYHLQYLLYGVALRRLLRGPGQRPGITPIAGAGYLFVRGMSGKSGSSGIFHTGLTDVMLDEFEQKTLPGLLAPESGGENDA
ncbi:MAG TPA: UvrD-helicase domain-containing protein [Candidatus Ozemobacteraceae bacterium]|nr:UvrD-helicase domain-containing protein [Candidatus Ozemobacteraceae bacterium]